MSGSMSSWANAWLRSMFVTEAGSSDDDSSAEEQGAGAVMEIEDGVDPSKCRCIWII